MPEENTGATSAEEAATETGELPSIDERAVAARLAAERDAALERCDALAARCAALEQRRGSVQAGANPPGGSVPPQRPLLGAELARARREQLGRYKRT